VKPVVLEVWSDYLCPWCHLADHRLGMLKEEFGDDLELEFKSYLLRPRPEERELEKFMRYTQSWMRPAGEPDAPKFQVWETSEGPPSHSVPAHLVAKAAERLGEAAFERIHQRLLVAYFEDNRDISDVETLKAIWSEAELPSEEFAAVTEPDLLRTTADQHNEALELGITGVPSVRVKGTNAFVSGAQPLETYRRWIDRLMQGVLDD
jgi:predicted DsbA family dithiol-disulfide isomerase